MSHPQALPFPIRLRQSLSLGLGLLDQIVISASGLILAILVARSVPISDFGAFTLAMTAVYFAASVQNSLVLAPHSVMAAPLPGNDFKEATMTGFYAQLVLCLVTAGGFLLAAGIASFASDRLAHLFLFGSLASVASQLQDFFRRVLYSKQRVAEAFGNDVVNYGMQAVGLIALYSVGRLDGKSALTVIAVCSASAAVLGMWQTRAALMRPLKLASAHKWALQGWSIGRWLLGSSLLSWLTTSLYPVLIAGFIGLSSVAVLRAAQTLLGPANIAFRFLDTTILPIASVRYSTGGKPALTKLLTRTLSVMLPGFLLLLLICTGMADWLMSTFFGDEYVEGSWILMPLSLSLLLTATSAVLGLGLKAMSRTGPQFVAYLAATFANLTFGTLAVWQLGLKGALLGILINSGVILVVVLVGYRSHSPSPEFSTMNSIGSPFSIEATDR